MLFSCTFGSVYRAAILLSCINVVICANYPVVNIIHARDGRSRPDDISSIIKSNHLEGFCSSWLGGTPTATTITTTKTDVKQQYTTVTVGKVMTVTKGVTTVTRNATATQGPGTVVAVKTSYTTETVTNLSTALVVVTSITPVSTKTVTTTIATNNFTSSAGVVTSVQTATSTVTSITTSTTTITPTFGTPTPTVTVARRHGGSDNRRPRRVPDCLDYAPDSLISAGCSLAYPPKTVTRTTSVYVTSIKSTQTSTVFTSTTTVPGKIQTVTSTSTTTIAKPTVTTTIKTTSIILSTVSSNVTTIIPTTLAETLPATLTNTILSTSTFLTTTTVTTTITSTAVATYTACPGQNRTPGAFGIGVNAGSGIINAPGAGTANECCLRCYDPAQSIRCSAWVFSAPGFCAFVANAAGPKGASPTCPNGLGDYFFLLGGNPDPNVEVGGPGPCAGTML